MAFQICVKWFSKERNILEGINVNVENGSTTMAEVFAFYQMLKGWKTKDVRYTLDGRSLKDDDTADELGLKEGDIIVAICYGENALE